MGVDIEGGWDLWSMGLMGMRLRRGASGVGEKILSKKSARTGWGKKADQ